MLNYLTLIFACQLVGEFFVVWAGISIPGPVIGMVLLLFFLIWRGAVPDELATVGEGLLRHLSLLFVPAGVGVMLHFGLLEEDAPAVGVALVASTVLTITVTALVMQFLSRSNAARKGRSTDGK